MPPCRALHNPFPNPAMLTLSLISQKNLLTYTRMTTSISSEAFVKKRESKRMKNNTKTRMTIFIKKNFMISEEIELLWSS